MSNYNNLITIINYNNFLTASDISPISCWHITWMAKHSPFSIQGYFSNFLVKKANGVYIYIRHKIIHGCLLMWNFTSCIQFNISCICCNHSWNIKFNTRREIPYLQTLMFYSLLTIAQEQRSLLVKTQQQKKQQGKELVFYQTCLTVFQ